jgi:hypothetical protein
MIQREQITQRHLGDMCKESGCRDMTNEPKREPQSVLATEKAMERSFISNRYFTYIYESNYAGDYTKENGMGAVCSMHRKMRNNYIILPGKPQGISPLGKHRLGCEVSIKIHLKETRCEGADWFNCLDVSIFLQTKCTK